MREGIIKGLRDFLIYIAIVLILIFSIPKILVFALKTPYPMASVTSASMWPVLKRGDLVFIKRADPKEIKVGTIIVYRGQGGKGFVIHRVVKRDKKEIVTKGDANTEEDQPITYKQIMGVILSIRGRLVKIPYLGYMGFLIRRSPKQ